MSNVSETLAAFLQQRLASIEQIEIVLLLRGDRARAWSASEVAESLRMPPEASAMRLFLLASAGLISFEPAGLPKYRYLAVDAATEELMGELEETYEKNREALRAAVGAPADPIRSFADAFRLKK